MIPQLYITEWAQHVPWQHRWQVEQDLIISKALHDIYSHPNLCETLAFRGGTALNKLFLKPALRYSEDIDLVQVKSAPIGNILKELRSVLDVWLGEPKRDSSRNLVTLTYRFTSDDNFRLKLKVEINSREHFTELGWQEMLFSTDSSWHTGTVAIKTYKLEEMMGTKLRALYQRRKGRDLYDLYHVLKSLEVDTKLIIHCFQAYMAFGEVTVTRKDFDENIRQKLKNDEFKKDIWPLLPQTNQRYDAEEAYAYVCEHLLSFWE